MKKHGDDINKMFLDIKTNVDQWSKGQLKKKMQALESHEYKDLS